MKDRLEDRQEEMAVFQEDKSVVTDYLVDSPMYPLSWWTSHWRKTFGDQTGGHGKFPGGQVGGEGQVEGQVGGHRSFPGGQVGAEGQFGDQTGGHGSCPEANFSYIFRSATFIEIALSNVAVCQPKSSPNFCATN